MQEVGLRKLKPLDRISNLARSVTALGLVGLMVRRNMVFVLMSLEIMLNASALAFIVAGTA